MATPVKRRATSVKLRREDNKATRIVGPAGGHTTAAFETVPLMQKLSGAATCPRADADDETFGTGPVTRRLTSSATVRERRRCLSAEDPAHRPVTSHAPVVDHTSIEATGRDESETASAAAINFLSPATTSATPATPTSTASSPTRKVSRRCDEDPSLFHDPVPEILCSYRTITH